jgi:2-polyprenyl-6-hydroxyphenyl methylase/3-demethylubiquinone-9 3-methyltransferase
MIAIYNRHWSSGAWWVVKWIYSRLGAVGQKVLLWIFAPIIYIAKFIATVEDPFIMRRGMDFWHNVVDWVGGFPYEYASVDEMKRFLNEIGLEVGMVRGTNTPIGCNEFLCEHKKHV